MFITRDARQSDQPGLEALARIFNTLNLPDDPEELRQIVTRSERAFAGEVPVDEREYLFVMEDTDTGHIIGTSQVMARHGTKDKPHIYFDVLKEERYSKLVERVFHHKVLRLGFDYDGPTEIGGLVLDPSYRGVPGKLGKQLSFVRFLFIGAQRENFRDRILAELLPPLSEDGRSVLWDALGARFTGLDYRTADRLSRDDKDFIKDLFPSGVIYASLLAPEAEAVIGEVGEATEGVRKMLSHIGFKAMGRIDPFDGGPHFEARTDDLWPVKNVRGYPARPGDGHAIAQAPGESYEGLVATLGESSDAPRFLATWSAFRIQDNVVLLPNEVFNAICASQNQTVQTLVFATHHRM